MNGGAGDIIEPPESGFKAVYWRNYVRYELAFPSLEDAREFLDEGSQENSLAIDRIVGSDGREHPAIAPGPVQSTGTGGETDAAT